MQTEVHVDRVRVSLGHVPSPPQGCLLLCCGTCWRSSGTELRGAGELWVPIPALVLPAHGQCFLVTQPSADGH